MFYHGNCCHPQRQIPKNHRHTVWHLHQSPSNLKVSQSAPSCTAAAPCFHSLASAKRMTTGSQLRSLAHMHGVEWRDLSQPNRIHAAEASWAYVWSLEEQNCWSAWFVFQPPAKACQHDHMLLRQLPIYHWLFENYPNLKAQIDFMFYVPKKIPT